MQNSELRAQTNAYGYDYVIETAQDFLSIPHTAVNVLVLKGEYEMVPLVGATVLTIPASVKLMQFMKGAKMSFTYTDGVPRKDGQIISHSGSTWVNAEISATLNVTEDNGYLYIFRPGDFGEFYNCDLSVDVVRANDTSYFFGPFFGTFTNVSSPSTLRIKGCRLQHYTTYASEGGAVYIYGSRNTAPINIIVEDCYMFDNAIQHGTVGGTFVVSGDNINLIMKNNIIKAGNNWDQPVLEAEVKYVDINNLLIENSVELAYRLGDIIDIKSSYLEAGSLRNVVVDFDIASTTSYAGVNGNLSTRLECENILIKSTKIPVGMRNCMNVRNCRSNSVTKYSGCYSGKTISSTYAASNSLNGGWND